MNRITCGPTEPARPSIVRSPEISRKSPYANRYRTARSSPMIPPWSLVLIGSGAILLYLVWRSVGIRRGRVRLEAHFRQKILDTNPDWRFVGIAMTHAVLTIQEATNIVLQVTAGDVDYEREVEPTLIEALKEKGELPSDYEIPGEELRAREKRRRARQVFR
ncbi:MAG: hypothetical protein CL933_03340 [Deltaproteobacteria bacterium]|nr:hypothetical protein [Deltaproteobacteria bacterium]